MDFRTLGLLNSGVRNDNGGCFSGAFAILIVIAIIGFCNWIAMILWNWIIPSIFDGHGVINFWQMLVLTMLINILFGRGNSK